jgi:uncharacterized phiE125 gp8 family phage protein
MTRTTVLVTPPAIEPISLDKAKEACRVDFTDDDDYITGLIVAARHKAENTLQRALITQTWDLYMDAFPRDRRIVLPYGKLQSVTSLKYLDSTETENTVAASEYHVVTWTQQGSITLKRDKQWPAVTLQSVGGVRVRFVAGYGDETAVPADIVHAMKMMIAHWYENREQVMVGQGLTLIDVPLGVDSLLWPHRILS